MYVPGDLKPQPRTTVDLYEYYAIIEPATPEGAPIIHRFGTVFSESAEGARTLAALESAAGIPQGDQHRLRVMVRRFQGE